MAKNKKKKRKSHDYNIETEEGLLSYATFTDLDEDPAPWWQPLACWAFIIIPAAVFVLADLCTMGCI